MTSWIVVAIYLSFIHDFVVAPVPSEASTHSLATTPGQVSTRQRVTLALAHAGLLLLWLYPLLSALMDIATSNSQRSGWWPLTGALLAVAGRGITVAASLELKRKGTAAVISSGVFSFSRHPVVVGLHLTLFGLLVSCACTYCLLLFPLTLLYFDQKVRIEEKALLQRFGVQYEDYGKTTPRYLSVIGQTLGR